MTIASYLFIVRQAHPSSPKFPTARVKSKDDAELTARTYGESARRYAHSVEIVQTPSYDVAEFEYH